MKIRAGFTYSNAGKRPCLEDQALFIDKEGIFAVADGFGGPEAGTAAAKAACAAIQDFLVKEAGDRDATMPFVLRSYYSLAGNVLFNSLIHANRRLLKLNRGKNVHEQGGASVMAAYLDEDLLALANVGVCTAILIRDGSLRELVHPRSYAALVDPWDANRPGRDLPLTALGLTEDLEPEVSEFRMRPGDWLILATDGLDPQAYQGLFALQGDTATEPEALARRALEWLTEREHGDNLAVSLAIF